MFALETAMDELALACGLDPIELRDRNEPAVDPETGQPFSSRNLVDCLREGARAFGWDDRDPRPARGATAVAGRHRRGVVDVPGAAPPVAGAARREADGTFAVASPPPTSAPARAPC